MNGIDVSEWQGLIDWSKVKTDFVIIRAGYGSSTTQKDRYFEQNYDGCRKNGIPCGAYWYSYAMTPDDARREAETFLEVIKGKKFEMPLYFDIEESRQFALGRDMCSRIAAAFLETVEKAGCFVGIYSSKSHLENYISEEIRKKYTVWVAHYGVTKTDYKGVYEIWQKSATGKIDGISGDVDLNVCYNDFPTIIKGAGLNGFAAEKAKKNIDISVTVGGINYSGTLTEK